METVAQVWKNDTFLEHLSFNDIENNKDIKLSDQGYNVILDITRYQKIKRMKEVLYMNNDKILVKQVKQEKQGTQWKTIETYPDNEITLEHFRTSFVDERWNGERRYNKQYTKLGYFHTKTIVPNPFDNTRSVRTFIFPN